jgi:hypothetical protein
MPIVIRLLISKKMSFHFNSNSVKRILICFFVIILSSCFPMPNHGLDFCLHNTSRIQVVFFFPSRETGYCMGGLIYEYDYLSEVSPLDTTIAGYQESNLGTYVKAGEIKNTYSSYEFDDLFQYDTLRVFVSKDVHKDTEPYDFVWENSFLVRYDISYNDASDLLNESGALELSYPPDIRMKNVKMWPKYEDVIRMSE